MTKRSNTRHTPPITTIWCNRRHLCRGFISSSTWEAEPPRPAADFGKGSEAFV